MRDSVTIDLPIIWSTIGRSSVHCRHAAMNHLSPACCRQNCRPGSKRKRVKSTVRADRPTPKPRAIKRPSKALCTPWSEAPTACASKCTQRAAIALPRRFFFLILSTMCVAPTPCLQTAHRQFSSVPIPHKDDFAKGRIVIVKKDAMILPMTRCLPRR